MMPIESVRRRASSLLTDAHTLLVRHQFLRYLIVGAANTAISYLSYAALLLAGIGYRLSSLFALVIGIAVSFVTQGTIVFHNATAGTFVKFVIAWLFLYGLNIALIGWLMTAPMNAYYAGAIAIAPVTLVSYCVLKVLVFAGRTRPQVKKSA